MHGLTKIALGVAMLGGSVAAANAGTGAAGPERYGAKRPCEFYLNHDVPAPRRCHRFFFNALGPDIYVRYGFVFRNHDSFVRYRDRGWFKDQDRLAAREERHQEGAANRDREREAMQRSTEHKQYAEREREDHSGREIAPETDSGGASHGATVYEKNESGGAGRGEHIHEGTSGGASGY